MCRLAGAVADGVQFALMTPEGVIGALAEVHAGMREAGRDPANFDVVLRVPSRWTSLARWYGNWPAGC